MIRFRQTTTGLDFEYRVDFNDNNWVWEELKTSGSCEVSSVFLFDRADLTNPPAGTDSVPDDYHYHFAFGKFENEYVRIPGRILGIDNDVLLPITTKFKRALFAAERNISIFRRLANLVDHKNPIVIGGTRKDVIPFSVFEELLDKFPNSYEMDRYAGARVQTVLSAYLDGMKDARGHYEEYLNKKMKGVTIKLDLESLKNSEVEKYIFIRNLIEDSLDTKTNLSEGEWQSLMISFLLLLFPKYIKVLEKVTINDYYTNPKKKTPRFIDIALVDANGNLDVIEVKKPFEDKILRKSQYRGNSIPTSELSGSIMQAEKYLFHLSKWGVKGEKTLTARYAGELPKGMSIRISNPKAIIVVGRDQIGGADMTGGQLLDFEVIKRKYANMMDIITYDDLLRRLNNTIAALTSDTNAAQTKP
jgi:Domain of unknown function (DUF4263)